MKDFDFFAELKRLELTRAQFCKMTGLTQEAVSAWYCKKAPIAKWTQSYLKFYESHIILENLKKGGFYIEKKSAPNIRERKLNARDLERLKRNEARREQKRAQKEREAQNAQNESTQGESAQNENETE